MPFRRGCRSLDAVVGRVRAADASSRGASSASAAPSVPARQPGRGCGRVDVHQVEQRAAGLDSDGAPITQPVRVRTAPNPWSGRQAEHSVWLAQAAGLSDRGRREDPVDYQQAARRSTTSISARRRSLSIETPDDCADR
jgi:hypothetical protein